jgi:Tol biopolymer transport system component
LKYFALIAACLFSLLTPMTAESRLDPRLRWLTVESDHFQIHYHESLADVVPHAVRIAEETHRRLSPELLWAPAAKTHLVLADVTDAPNGFSTPFPYNRIIIFLTPPLEQPFSLTDQENWLRLVITHEYAHTLHLDTVHGLPAWLRQVFGRVYFPNLLQPAWGIEGLATYYETRATAGGRGHSPYTDMVLRMAVLDGRFPTLAQAAVFPDSWPAGETPYLFGVKFYDYLVERYGPELPGRLSRNYGGRSLPFMVDSTARRTFGFTFKQEWPRWQEVLTEHYQTERERIGEPWPSLVGLTEEGYRNIFPAVSPSGALLAYSSQTADRVASLLLMNADGSGRRVLLRRLVLAGGAGISWLPDESGLVYAKLERDSYDNIFYDLFRYDLAAGREYRLTRGLRAASPDVSPAGGDIVCVLTAAGRSRLAMFDAEGGNLRYLSHPEDRHDYFSPRWSPDGRRIVVGARDDRGSYTLRIIDTAGGLLTEWTPGPGIHSAPDWSPDGRTVYFSSDHSGIYNLYAWRPEEQSLRQVTHLLGGAFSPAVSPAGDTLYLTTYGAAGFDLAAMPLDNGQWRQIEPRAVVSNESGGKPEAAPAELVARVYAPGATLLPRYWFPWLGSDEDGLQLGAITSGHDPIERHRYTATFLYGTQTRRPAYSLLYQYDGRYPTVEVFASDQAIFYDDFFRLPGRPEVNFWERRRAAGINLVCPFPGFWARHFLIPGYRFQRFDGLTPPPAGQPQPDEGKLSGVRLSYRFDNTVRPPRAISPEDGRRTEIAVQRDDSRLGSDFSLTRFTLDWHEFIDIHRLRHHNLAIRLFGGTATGDRFDQRAFRIGGDPAGDLLQGVDSEFLPLRGYPINAFRGQKAVLASGEYRFPVMNIENGVGNGPIFLRRLHGAVFYEGASAFDQSFHLDEMRTSAGLEARLDADLGYVLPVTLRFVVVRGFDEDGEDQAYFSLWFRL